MDKKIDNQFNELIRELSLSSCCVYSQNVATSYNRDDIETCIEIMKDDIFTIPIDNRIDIIETKELYISLINYVNELLYIVNNVDLITMKKQVKAVKDRILPILKEKEIKAELQVFAMHVGGRFDNTNKKFKDIITAIAGICSILAEYLQTYIYKYKNKKIEYISEENHISIKYTNYELFYKEQIKYMKKYSLSGEEDKTGKFVEYTYKITDEISQAYYKFVNQNKENYMGYLYIQEDLELPLINENGSIELSEEELLQIPTQRKYAIHKNGVEFIFKCNKSIDKIEMFEDVSKIKFNVWINNNGNLYKSKTDISTIECLANPLNDIAKDNKAALKKNRISQNKIKLCFDIDKEKFNNTVSVADKILSIRNLNYTNGNNDSKFPYYIRLILLACIYVAYNNPNRFSTEISLYNRHLKQLGSKRKYDFIIGHIRRLPKNCRMSEQAKINAQKEGFLCIPDSYTFVSTFCKSNITRKKIIKIN